MQIEYETIFWVLVGDNSNDTMQCIHHPHIYGSVLSSLCLLPTVAAPSIRNTTEMQEGKTTPYLYSISVGPIVLG